MSAPEPAAPPSADSGRAGPSIWIVSDGRAGIERQALSLAQALRAPERARRLAHIRSDAHRDTPIRLNPTGWQTPLPPDLWPAPLAALPNDQRAALAPPWPDVWIATGRRSIPYSRRMKQWSGGKTLVVQTQDPRTDLTPYDLVIPPEHDGLTGANVFPILGPPTYFAPEAIEAARKQFTGLAGDARMRVLVSIGGNSRTHRYTPEVAARIEDFLRQMSNDVQLWITVSRRTPEDARSRLRQLAKEVGGRFWEDPERDGPNPYLAWLTLCDAVFVTEDSANMLADPAYFGKPIYLTELEGDSKRFSRLHQGFIDRGAARWFHEDIELWTYEPVREVERAADEIARLLLVRHPAPLS